jgi:hypothetical protein
MINISHTRHIGSSFFEFCEAQYGTCGVFDEAIIESRVTGSSNIPIEDDEPLLQSAKVHRKLKTGVPSEPS